MSVNVYGSVKLEQEMNRLGLGKFVTILTENGFDNWPAVCDITQDDYDQLGFDVQSQCLLQRLIVDSQTCDYDSPFNLTDNHATMNQSPATTEQQQTSPNGRQPRLGANGKRRYRRHPKPDLNASRRPLTAYASFANYVRTEQAISALSFVEIAREVGKRWQSLAQEERNTWEQHATGALNEYKQQVEKYKKTEQSRAYQRYLGDFKRQQQATQRVKEEDEDNEHELPEATEQACSVPRLCVADSTASSSSTVSHSTSDSVDSSSFLHIEPPRTSSQINSRTTIDIFPPVSEYSPERTGLMGQNSMVHGSAQSIFHIMVGPESSLSRVIIDFRDRCRWLIAQGTPFSAICGPDHIDVAAFFDRSRDMGLRVDGWACSLNHSFSDMDVYVLLAYIMFHTHFMRWMIYPTAALYSKIPLMLQLTEIQKSMAHPYPIDLVPIPVLRDALVVNLRDWFTPGRSLSVNWPHTLEECLERHPEDGSLRLSNIFMEHVQKYENWSVDSDFIKCFPELQGRIRVK